LVQDSKICAVSEELFKGGAKPVGFKRLVVGIERIEDSFILYMRNRTPLTAISLVPIVLGSLAETYSSSLPFLDPALYSLPTLLDHLIRPFPSRLSPYLSLLPALLRCTTYPQMILGY